LGPEAPARPRGPIETSGGRTREARRSAGPEETMTVSLRVSSTAPPPEGGSLVVRPERRTSALFRSGGALYGLDERCTHVGGPISQGPVADGVVTCPW